uniref:Solute carrier family 19 member 3a n=2 Tax=Cyprinodon variegatus TaxID=28743 RepID=A0A3Q2DAE3_CYPVA
MTEPGRYAIPKQLEPPSDSAHINTKSKQANMENVKRLRSDWRYPTTLLCIYGFFSTVKPLEPFLIPFLTGKDKNLTTEQVNSQIFPVWTYSYLSVLVPVFLLTDWLRYKPVVVLQCVMLFITTALLRWTESVPAMQAMQFCYGVATASEVAYFSYIYSVVDLKRYRKATSYSRSVQLLGYTVGSVLGQLLVSFNLMSYNNILVFTLVLTAIALITSCFLPMPKRSMFFHRKDSGERASTEGTKRQRDGSEDKENDLERSSTSLGDKDDQEQGVDEDDESDENKGAKSCSQVVVGLWRDFRRCYSSRQLLYWSVWWAMATCGYNQTVNYVQVLWEHVQPSQNFSIYNGGVEATSNLLSAATAYGIGFTDVRWEQWGELALGGFSGLGAAALFLMTFTNNIWVCYSTYAIFKCLYMLLITIAMYQIATDLSMERYALVFGANNFGALLLQTIITAVVVDSGGLGLAIVPQFIIYASYFLAISLVFSIRGVFSVCKTQRMKKKQSTVNREQPEICEEYKF